MKYPDPPRHVNTSHGRVRVLVLPWLQYIKLRSKRHGIKNLFKKTSSGYPRIFSFGYYSKSHGEIVLAKVGNYQLRYLHELGHANGKKHVMIEGDVMHPYGFKRGPYMHFCAHPSESIEEGCCDKGAGCTQCRYLRKAFVSWNSKAKDI